MEKVKVKKEKVIREFREELKIKGMDKKGVFDKPFFQILNDVYKYHPNDIKCHITFNKVSKNNILTFLVKIDHTYISIAWYPNQTVSTMLSITKMNSTFEDGGIYQTTLEKALNKIEKICNKKI